MCSISFSTSGVLRVDVRSLMDAGQERRLPVLRPWIGNPPGHMATKPGRFWFSLPSPYVSQLPMLGRGSRASPQFINSSDGS